MILAGDARQKHPTPRVIERIPVLFWKGEICLFTNTYVRTVVCASMLCAPCAMLTLPSPVKNATARRPPASYRCFLPKAADTAWQAAAEAGVAQGATAAPARVAAGLAVIDPLRIRVRIGCRRRWIGRRRGVRRARR
jgi:hypothetical protein